MVTAGPMEMGRFVQAGHRWMDDLLKDQMRFGMK